ncbi:MAG: acetyl-CoA carboxylase biotin carboxylase subunit, partial [Acidimicrobiales bacterium]
LCEEIGLPVLVKAVAGGGGRGMRLVREQGALGASLETAMAEAAGAFGDPRVYLERYLEHARHVEVQVLGDGRVAVHLGDRDCSVQRRHQKLVEEAPAPLVEGALRSEMQGAAVRLARRLGYRSLGTVELLLDSSAGRFFFLEVNARIQVEHPVTEEVTGLDLVAEQIAVAEGVPLRLRQEEIEVTGHAVEARINAEDPSKGFRPSPGRVRSATFPAGPGIRVDSALQAGTVVPAWYDSLVAKVIASGPNRPAALGRLASALERCRIEGIHTTTSLQHGVITTEDFRTGGVDTQWLERFLARDQSS